MFATVILVSQRTDDIHACLEDDSRVWGCGKTLIEAIGNLISHHKEEFGSEIQKLIASNEISYEVIGDTIIHDPKRFGIEIKEPEHID